MADSSLNAIRTKVRRLTRSPSESQLSTAQLDQYINTFILYDFPENIRLFSLRTLLTFYTQPGVDVYETNTIPNDPLNNFKNKYIAVHPPVYLAGIQGFYTQWRDVFYGYYPQTNTISDTLLRGNGGTGPFSSLVIQPPPVRPPLPFILQRSVNFNVVDTSGTSMIMVDTPISNTVGNLRPPGVALVAPFDTTVDPNNNINYVTGRYTVTFPNPTQVQAPIWFEGILYQPGKPLAVLYYDDKFTIRPVPDKTYAIQFEVDIRPTELLAAGASPYLEQWWQYVSMGAARKIFEDRMDSDSVQMLMPEFSHQENLVLRTTLTQQANERTVTIYTQGKTGFFGGGWGGLGWPY